MFGSFVPSAISFTPPVFRQSRIISTDDPRRWEGFVICRSGYAFPMSLILVLLLYVMKTIYENVSGIDINLKISASSVTIPVESTEEKPIQSESSSTSERVRVLTTPAVRRIAAQFQVTT